MRIKTLTLPFAAAEADGLQTVAPVPPFTVLRLLRKLFTGHKRPQTRSSRIPADRAISSDPVAGLSVRTARQIASEAHSKLVHSTGAFDKANRKTKQ